MNGVSESVLEALAGALQLDEAERAHLFDLARAAQPTPAAASPRARPSSAIRPEVQWTLDAITGAAAFVQQRPPRHPRRQPARARAVSPSCTTRPARPVNTARFVFLDPRAETIYGDWDRVASERRHPALRRRPRPPQPRPLRPRRRTRNPERGVPHPLGRTQRPLPQHRRQALPPSRRRRPPPDLQPARPRRRPRPDALHLHRRARLPLRGGAQAPRQLGSHRRPRRIRARDRPKLRRTGRPGLAAPLTRSTLPCGATATSGPAFTSARSFCPHSGLPPNARKPSTPRSAC